MAEHFEEGVLEEGPEDPAIAQEGDHTIRGRLVLTAASSEESVEQGDEVPLVDVNPLVRFPLLLFNLTLCLAGMGLTAVSALLLLQSLQWREDIQALRLGGLGGLLMSHLELALLAAGLVLSAVSCCGCVGALRENACLLRAYSVALLCLIMAATVLGTLVLVMPAGAKRVVQRTLSATLVVHYRDSPDAQQLVDAVQRHLSCCGMTSKSFRDWNDNMYVPSSSLNGLVSCVIVIGMCQGLARPSPTRSYFNCSAENPSHERCSVPHSCCKSNASLLAKPLTAAGFHCGRGVLNMSDYEAWFHINWNNCADAALHALRTHALAVCGGCLALSLGLAFLDALAHTTRAEIALIRDYYARRGL
ncbi:tetraspanin-33-like [Dermacentor variabilis]|uniref:tetraspanin-33-like n=1 Tax=Dermacentor variabilis TaxID=34621 RepID=UPI003F5CBB39